MQKSKLEQYNQAYKKALPGAIIKLIPDLGTITIADVLIDPSLTHGKVWVRVSVEGLSRIEERRGDIQKEIVKHVKTRYTPKLQFIQDDQYLDHLDDLFASLGQPKNED